MPNVRYVCLSDLHLGEEDSLLTNIDPSTGKVAPNSPSPVLGSMLVSRLSSSPRCKSERHT